MNTLVIEKQTGGYFKFTLNGDTANAITSIQNDLLAVGTQLHFKTGNGANIIKEQFIYPADVTIIASGTFTFTTVAQVWDKLIDIDYFAWLGGGGTGGVDRFDDLLDTFSYTGNAGKAVVVDGAELRLVPITLYNKRLFTELEDTPSSLVPNKMLVVNPAGTAVVLQDQPEQPEQLLNSVGYFDYNDLITQTIPLVAVANVALKLTNDTEGANTSTDQNPYGVSYVWDYTTNQFNFNELEVGDTIDVRIHVQVTTTTSNQKVLLSAKFGIGSVSEFTNTIYENQFKSAGLHEINFVAPFYMGSTYITDNPAELYLTSDASATVKVDGWYVRILRKNINIITVDYTVPDATGSVKGIVRLAGDLAGTANSPTVPELANKVPNTRTVSTTSPLLGGGALSSNLTLSIQQANSVDSGYLTYADWGRFDEAHRDRIVSAAVTGTTTKTLTLTQHDAGTITTSWTDDNTDAVSSVFGRTGAVVAVSGDYTTSLVTESTNKNYQTDNQKLYNDATSSIQTQLNSKANDNAVVHLTGAETITGKKTFDSSAGSSDAIEIISNSTGYGIKLSHPSGGTAIFVSNPVGVGLNVNNIGTNSFGISISNPSTGRAIDIGNGGAGTGISLSNSGSGYGISISNPSTGTGIFSSNTGGVSSVGISSHNTSSGTGFYSLNTSTGRGIWSANTGTYGIYSENAGAGDGIYSQNSSTGKAFSSWNSSTGIGIYSNNTSSGKGLVLNNTTAATGIPFTVSKNGTDVFTINDAGEATGVKFIKSGGTSSQFLKADGSVDSTTYQTALTNPVTGTGTTNYIPKFTGASAIGNSLIFDNGTNVGIGTASPSTKLDVAGAIRITGVDSAGYQFAKSSDNTNFYLSYYTTSAKYKDLITFNYDGNVGIGTTSPSTLLTISGLAPTFTINRQPTGTQPKISYTDNGSEFAYIQPSAASSVMRYDMGPSAGWGGIHAFYTDTTEKMRLNSNGELCIGRTSAYGAGWLVNVEGNIYAKNDLRIDGGGSFGGSVGIGTTTSPNAKLEIASGSPSSAEIQRWSYNNSNPNFYLRLKQDVSEGLVKHIFDITNNGTLYSNNLVLDRGNVGIGTDSPSQKLTIGDGTATGNQYLRINGSGSDIYIGQSVGTLLGISPNSGGLIINDNAYPLGVGTILAQPLIFGTTNAERMRITSGGDLLIGKTAAGYNTAGIQTEGTGTRIGITRGTSGECLYLNKINSETGNTLVFYYNGTAVGTVSITSSATSYNTSSDYRLKQDLQPINGLDLVSQIKVYDYEWKSDETRAYGVLAHELQEVIPQAVNGEKDGENMQGVDYSKLVPILVQAIQELKQEIEILKNK